MAILEVHHIEKHFGATRVLEDISFDLEQGQALAIIGSSGSGKTTLLRCLNFLEKPEQGTISVAGPYSGKLSEVTQDLHANGPVGVMTDYEAKFHEQGLPICRCVATMVPWEEPFPTDIRRVKNRWLDVFADGVSDAELGRHVLSDGNYLWHLFSWNLVPCLSGDAARQALSEASGEKYLFYYEEPPEGEPLVRPVTAEKLVTLPADAGAIPGADWYVVDKDFTWTFAQTHEADCGPYFCRKA